MYFYNLRYELSLRSGCATVGVGSVIQASAMPLAQLERRYKSFKKFGHLQRRIFDPQLYLSRLDAHRAGGSAAKLATYPWFGVADVPEYNSDHQTLAEYKAETAPHLLTNWRQRPVDDLREVRQAAKSAIEFQMRLGCEIVILPVPMIDSLQDFFAHAAEWIDEGIEACKELRVNIPIYATVAISDTLLRGTTATREALVGTITGHISTRVELGGAYIVVEQSSEDSYCCQSYDTCEAILLLIDDIVRGAGKRVFINYAGSFGPVAIAAGAWAFASGYFRSQRRLKLADFDEVEGRAFPRYFSLPLMGDVSPDAELDQLAAAGRFKLVRTATEAAHPLNTTLDSGGRTEEVPTWAYSQSNLSGAIPHYSEVMNGFALHLDNQTSSERAEFVHKVLRRSVDIAAMLRSESPRLRKADLTHQQVWLNALEWWRSKSGI